MNKVSTAQILVEKALRETCGQACVDWAVNMLVSEIDSESLRILAGMQPPFNHFELSNLRDKALDEIGVVGVENLGAIHSLAVGLLENALQGEIDMYKAVGYHKDLSTAFDYPTGLKNFYLLYYAHSDLQNYEEQYYWPKATRENIDSIIHHQAEEFINTFKRTA